MLMVPYERRAGGSTVDRRQNGSTQSLIKHIGSVMSRFYHVDFRSVRPPAVLWCKPSGQCASQVRAHLGSSCPSAPAALLQPGAGAEPSSHPRVRRSLVRWSRPASHRSPPLQAKEYKSVGFFFYIQRILCLIFGSTPIQIVFITNL